MEIIIFQLNQMLKYWYSAKSLITSGGIAKLGQIVDLNVLISVHGRRGLPNKDIRIKLLASQPVMTSLLR